MKNIWRNILLLFAIFVLSGCSKNADKQEQLVPKEQNNEVNMINPSDYRTTSTLIDVSNDGVIEISYEVKFGKIAPIRRIFLLTDGYPAEFSLNNSDMAYYHDMEGDDLSQIKIAVKPSVKNKNVGDEVIVTPFIVLMDESINFTDDLFVFYSGDRLGVNAQTELSDYVESKIEPVNIEFSEKVVAKSDDEKQKVQHLLVNAQEEPFLNIVTKDSFINSKGMHGFDYVSEETYYVSKIGVGEIYIYPLLNGEYMKRNGEILSFFFPESEYDEQMYYAPFDLKEYNIKNGDIITFLTWNSNKNEPIYGGGKIAIQEN